jgi:dihydroflavonol-4-reductase
VKVLVTGATGLIGSQVVRRLLESGSDVRILRRESSPLGLLADCSSSVEHCTGDVTDRHSIFDAARGANVVFHLAGAVGLNGRKYRSHLLAVNVDGTAAVVDAAIDAGVERLIHTSSIAALGRPDTNDQLMDESTEWVESPNNSEYAKSKRLAELEVFRGVAEGLDAVIVNPSLVFGPGRPGENTLQIVERVRNGKLPAVPYGGTNVVDSEDVARGHLLALEKGQTGERYILGSENLDWRTIIDTIAAAFGVDAQQRMLSPRLSMALASALEFTAIVPGVRPLITREAARQTSGRFWYDNRRARADLGCTFRPFAASMQRLASLMTNHDPVRAS